MPPINADMAVAGTNIDIAGTQGGTGSGSTSRSKFFYTFLTPGNRTAL